MPKPCRSPHCVKILIWIGAIGCFLYAGGWAGFDFAGTLLYNPFADFGYFFPLPQWVGFVVSGAFLLTSLAGCVSLCSRRALFAGGYFCLHSLTLVLVVGLLLVFAFFAPHLSCGFDIVECQPDAQDDRCIQLQGFKQKRWVLDGNFSTPVATAAPAAMRPNLTDYDSCNQFRAMCSQTCDSASWAFRCNYQASNESTCSISDVVADDPGCLVDACRCQGPHHWVFNPAGSCGDYERECRQTCNTHGQWQCKMGDGGFCKAGPDHDRPGSGCDTDACKCQGYNVAEGPFEYQTVDQQCADGLKVFAAIAFGAQLLCVPFHVASYFFYRQRRLLRSAYAVHQDDADDDDDYEAYNANDSIPSNFQRL